MRKLHTAKKAGKFKVNWNPLTGCINLTLSGIAKGESFRNTMLLGVHLSQTFDVSKWNIDLSNLEFIGYEELSWLQATFIPMLDDTIINTLQIKQPKNFMAKLGISYFAYDPSLSKFKIEFWGSDTTLSSGENRWVSMHNHWVRENEYDPNLCVSV